MENGVMMQYFEWFVDNDPHLWLILKNNAKMLKDKGITAIWMPPAFKGIGGIHDVGYGVYDVYDLGEFDQKGTVRTKYGTKDEYLDAIKTLKSYGIQVYGDIVLNHKMGADENEEVKAFEVNNDNTNEIISGEETIEVATVYNFPNRHKKYSDFTWDWSCFNGIDYDIKTRRNAKYLFESKQWNSEVDSENGNFDYLMGADIDFKNDKVLEEMDKWGLWYMNMTHLDGFRLDAVKHIEASFYRDWIRKLRESYRKELFTVGEYWHGDVQKLLHYLKEVDYEVSLFDVPLHYHFYDACHSNGQYDMSKIFDGTLVQADSGHAVTFVDNHDTQPSQGLQSWIDDWFKPLAYALIMLRKDGYPCVFYGDYYGIKHHQIESKKDMLDEMLYLRKYHALGEQIDYLDDSSIIGWTRQGNHLDGLACLLSDSVGGQKRMFMGKEYANTVFVDRLKNVLEEITIDKDGYGCFKVNGGSVSVYVKRTDI
ncbi:MAG: alpha-amylase [Coprobacillus sp.]